MKRRKLDLISTDTMHLNQHISLRAVFVLSIVSSVYAADLQVTYTIPEEQTVNTFIGNILNDTENLKGLISDEDFPNLRFSFLSEGNTITSLFSLSSLNGDLKVGPNSTLDRERICPFTSSCEIALDVVVQSPLSHLFKKVAVKVVLKDVNDNSPKFPNPVVNLDVSEAVLVGASIPLEGASDADRSMNNSLQSYEIVPTIGAFGISYRQNLDGTTFLNLIVREELDHETQDKYSLQIIAKDGGQPQRQGVLSVNVAITDVNDNVPKFTEQNYTVTIDENVSHTSVIINVHATDDDSGDNGNITYKLSSHQDLILRTLFNIDPISGDMTIKGNLEKEATAQYNVIVEAIDHALQPFTSQTVVTINVRDVINSPPTLTVNVLSDAAISEYASVGTVIAHVAVKESDRGRNGIVSCQLDDPNYFQLQGYDLDEYKVIVEKPLDSEITQQHSVTVICQDAGTPPLSSNFSFVVTVIDENDNSPIFTNSKYSGKIAENSGIGSSVLNVSASDQDRGQNGRIRFFLGPESAGHFKVSPEDGIILTDAEIDYETNRRINFSVLAVDGGKPAKTATAQVSIEILDVNDERPKFSQKTFILDVSEAANPGEIVSLISAFDFETGRNGEIEYFLIDKKPSTPFTLLSNGSLVLDTTLDYESKQVFGFKVMAIDKGIPRLNSTAEIIVKVKDENDNIPIITFPNTPSYLINVTFADNKGTVITRLRAIDSDSGLNGQLRYVITSRNDSGRFEVDLETGDIYTMKSYNFKDIDFYKVIIGVQDMGTPPMAAHITIYIKLEQGNGTAALGQDDTSDQNILITLSIVCITIVFAAIVVLIIVIMRHKDRKNQSSGSNSGNQSRLETTQYDAVVKTNGSHDLHPHLADDSGYSFSVSSDKSAVLQNPSCIENKSKTSEPTRDRNLSSNSTNSHVSSDGGRQESSNVDNLTALQLHKALLQNYKQTHGANDWSRHNAADDVNSDASGETTTSDSGRGGSEEDVCSHNETHNFDEADTSRDFHVSNNSFQSYGTGSASSVKPKDVIRGSARKHVTFRDHRSPNNHNSSASSNPVQNHNKRFDNRKPNILYTHASQEQNRQNPSNQNELYKSDKDGHHSKSAKKLPVLSENDYIPMHGRVMHPRGWRNDSIVTITTEDGDDRSTTTSGSYTVDEDRFVNLDFNHWNDVVV